MTKIWLAVDKDGMERLCEVEPERYDGMWDSVAPDGWFIELPKGTIEKILGRKLTWDDEPVMVEG